MKNKYYTPSEEEFHEGFDYEIFENFDKPIERTWQPLEYKYTYLLTDATPFPIREGRVRVKHLDPSDIEDLNCDLVGFETRYGADGFCVFKNTKEVGFNNLIKYTLEFNTTSLLNNVIITVEVDNGFENSTNTLPFTIRNKFEMKKLMEFLKIDLTDGKGNRQV